MEDWVEIVVDTIGFVFAVLLVLGAMVGGILFNVLLFKALLGVLGGN